MVTRALVATIDSAVINAWIESWKSRRSTKLDALTVAVELDGYAMTCSEKLSEHDVASISDGSVGNYLGRVPDLPELYMGAGFFCRRKANPANRILVFPQEVCQVDQPISFWWNVGEPGAMRSVAEKQVAKIGFMSSNLASELGEEFNLSGRDLSSETTMFEKYFEPSTRDSEQDWLWKPRALVRAGCSSRRSRRLV